MQTEEAGTSVDLKKLSVRLSLSRTFPRMTVVNDDVKSAAAAASSDVLLRLPKPPESPINNTQFLALKKIFSFLYST